MAEFGENIKKAREEKGFTQQFDFSTRNTTADKISYNLFASLICTLADTCPHYLHGGNAVPQKTACKKLY